MDKDELFTDFTQKNNQIEVYYDLANELTEKEVAHLSEQEALKQSQGLTYDSHRIHTFNYRDPISGAMELSEPMCFSYQDSIKLITHYNNRQLHWLLAEAYENFLDYITRLYCLKIEQDNHLWPLDDRENKTIESALSMDKGKLFKYVLRKTDSANKILDALHKKTQTSKGFLSTTVGK